MEFIKNLFIEAGPLKYIVIGVLIMLTYGMVKKLKRVMKRRYRKAKYLAKKSIRKLIIAMIFGI